jgi:hypothetical protein
MQTDSRQHYISFLNKFCCFLYCKNGFISVTLCKSTVPILIGLVRSMGRLCTGDPPLLCRLFPRPEPPIPAAPYGEVGQLNKQRSFSNFRSVHEVMGKVRLGYVTLLLMPLLCLNVCLIPFAVKNCNILG